MNYWATMSTAANHCQEHAKATGGNLTLTVKPWWPIRSRKIVLAVTGV